MDKLPPDINVNVKADLNILAPENIGLTPHTPKDEASVHEPEPRRISPEELARFVEKSGLRGFTRINEKEVKNAHETLKAEGPQPVGKGLEMLGLMDTGFFRLLKELDGEIDQSRKWLLSAVKFGYAISILGLAILGLLLASEEVRIWLGKPNATEATASNIYILHRLAFIVFLELFAFFFFKYAQRRSENINTLINERTNIEMQYNAMLLALATGNERVIEHLVNKFVSTERNFVIPQGSTTVELEKLKIEKSFNESLASLLKEPLINLFTKK